MENSPSDSPDFAIIIGTLKEIIRKRKITYHKLSKKSGIPESTIKKIFTGSDCSLKRLIRIADAVPISFLDLTELAKSGFQEKVFSFTHDQETFFANNLLYYLVFNRLHRHQNTNQEVREMYAIHESDFFKILQKLEQFNLLENLPGDKVKIKVSSGLHFLKDGPLLKKILSTCSHEFINHLILAPDTPDIFFRLNFGEMSEATFKDLQRSLGELQNEFMKKSIRDRKVLAPDDLASVTWLLGLSKVDGLAALNEQSPFLEFS